MPRDRDRRETELLRRVDPLVGQPGGVGIRTPAIVRDPGAVDYVPWFPGGWLRRYRIRVPCAGVAGDLASYKLYLSGACFPTSFWEDAQTSGNDLLFTADDGVTQLSHDLPHFAKAGQTLETHVLLSDTLSSTADTVLYAYIGNPGAADQRDAAGVWAGDHVGVWHLGEASGDYADSTGHGWTGADNVSPGGKSGKLYATGGETFDGGDYIALPATIGAAHSGHSGTAVSFWYKRGATGSQMRVYASMTSASFGRLICEFTAANLLSLAARTDAGTATRTVTTAGAFADTASWHHVVAVADIANDLITIYHDGALAASGAAAFTPTTFDGTNGTAAAIAATYGGGSLRYNGLLDEMRLYAGVPSAARIATEYANQNSPTTFVQIAEAPLYDYRPWFAYDRVGFGAGRLR